ncbi:MAG TPA: response regulator, partial [Accumulibacter sp.]|nr:response regulator [Accumulibacter sp.]
MTQTAELVLPNDVQPETVPTEPLDALATQTPAIEPRMAQLLELNQGFELVGEAASGQEGIDLAKQLDPDLILLDLNMKGMSGLETLSTMRDLEIDARIILITVSNAPEDLVAAIRAGSDGYILKDNDPDDILKLIDAA